MKHIITILTVCTVLSCTKQQSFPGTASLTLVNAVPNSTPSLVTNFSGTDPITYSSALKLEYSKSALNLSYTGEQHLAIYKYPDTLAHNTPLYNLALDLAPGTIYTLFLTGTLSSPDTMFTIDTPPFHPLVDSTLGIRFVNLSSGSTPVSVNLVGRANGSEVSGLSYKNITGFTKYSATAAVSKYTFEFRNAATGVLISSFDVADINLPLYNKRRYRNFTLALIGLPGDQKVMMIESNPYT
jgi:hypothetical protein